jgi:hypothetical protein
MNNNVKGILVVGGLAVIGYIVYKKLHNPVTFVAKQKAKDFPNKPYSEHLYDVKSYFKDNPMYVKNWAKAIKEGQSTFMFGGNTYNTKGGSLTKK